MILLDALLAWFLLSSLALAGWVLCSLHREGVERVRRDRR